MEKIKTYWILLQFGVTPLRAVETALRWFGKRFIFSTSGTRTILFSDPADIRKVFEMHGDAFKKDQFTFYMKELWGKGIILAESEEWRNARRRTQPYFGAQFLKAYSIHFRNLILSRVRNFEGGTIDVSKLGLEVSLEAILQTLFGIDATSHTQRIAGNLNTILKYFIWLQAAAGFTENPERFRLPIRRKYEQAIHELRDFAEEVMALATGRKQPERYMVDKLVQDWSDGKSNLHRETIKDEIVTFLIAGHESTALTIGYTLKLISQHPQCIDKLRNEYSKYSKASEGPVILSKDAPLMEAVIKESLRLYPPVWISGREATRTVEINGLTLNLGDQAHLCIWNAHRDPRHYEQPNSFLPERWLSDSKDLCETGFFPFGAGPRQCIGMQYAYSEIGIVIGEILHLFDVSPSSDARIPLIATVTIRPKAPIKLSLSRRTT